MSPDLRRRKTSRACYGFTIVELAVVLVVVGLLAGLIIPSLIKARHQASALKCLDNCRALGEAFIQYSQNNDGRLVPFSQPRPSAPDKNNSSELLWTELLGKHSVDHQPWYCPECSSGTHGGLAYNRLLASRGITLGEVLKPAQTVVVGDAGPVSNPNETNPDLWRENVSIKMPVATRARFEVPGAASWQPVKQSSVRMLNRHRGRASAIFADGRAQRLPVSQVGFQYEAGDDRALWDNQ